MRIYGASDDLIEVEGHDRADEYNGDRLRFTIGDSRVVMRDWIQCPITMKRGLTGAKPEAVCWWAFEVVGAEPTDTLDDMFPGTGAVTRAWSRWGQRMQVDLFGAEVRRG